MVLCIGLADSWFTLTAIELRLEMSVAHNLHSFIIYQLLLTGFRRIKISF